MLGLMGPDSLRRYLALALLVSLTPMAMTSCSSDTGPTATQAGQTLKKHILQLLKERNAENVVVTDPGGKDIPCGDGKAKQTFAATGDDLPERKPDVLVDSLWGALGRVAPYEFVSAGDPGAPVRLQSKMTRTVLVLSSPRSGKYLVTGETFCLDEE
ncbi:hypothetical protein GCM10022226_17260 [Sphaerisporangium flaviroseum]|uniref:Lipoprotein n=2 Tax=Sphaerisporangium flaviroseum TaxID=509199 RepID=A0ABP7HNJ7_9ACTN